MIRLRCPKCDRPWGVDNSLSGELWTCPGCRFEFAVTAGPAVSPAIAVADHSRRESSAPARAKARPDVASRRPIADVADQEGSDAPQGVHAKGGAGEVHHPGEL